MKNIRLGIFETNSSSTHDLSIKFKKQSGESLEISEDTCIIYGVNQFDDLYPVVYGERQKLNYLFTWMYIRDDGVQLDEYWNNYSKSDDKTSVDIMWPFDSNNLINLETNGHDWQYKNLLSAIQRKYPEVKRICFKEAKNSYFDHQTAPYEDEGFLIDLDDVDIIYNYLFNDHLIIEIGHD